jgi:hypothetical protein
MSNKDTIIEALTMQLKIEREGNLALAKREWVGLTDQEVKDIREDFTFNDEDFNEVGFAKAIEVKLKEKNCG